MCDHAAGKTAVAIAGMCVLASAGNPPWCYAGDDCYDGAAEYDGNIEK